MNVASSELCKELYELSAWELPKVGSGWWYVTVDGNAECFMSSSPMNTDEVLEKFPAYDLGYLVRKLPTWSNLIQDGEGWHAIIQLRNRYIADADTPEDAVAMLAIELFKQGILTRS